MKKLLVMALLAALPMSLHAAGNHAGGHAYGRPGDPAKVSRTIEVSMNDDMRFMPSTIRIKAGETVRFFLRNRGKLPHEFVLGSHAELAEHAAEMRSQPHMQHNDPNMAAVAPGRMGGLIWRFDRPGTYDFACLVPGHLEAGMVGRIEVE